MAPLAPLLALLCTAGSPAPAAPYRALAVAAAASLRPALEPLKQGFEAAHPGVELGLTFGASGALVTQLQQGAPFDLFLSADRDYPSRLVALGLARAEDERVFAVGELVLWFAPGAPPGRAARGLAALADPAVRRVAIANPAVAPWGRVAERVLREAGLLEAVREKLVLGTSVGQAAQFAGSGAAEAALLPRSILLGALESGQRVALPASAGARLEQSGVVLASAAQPGLARAFLAWLGGADGRAALLRCGYQLP
jgi:molybdate transport system substrate-binding protein